MKLPSDYLRTVKDGAGALHAIARRVRDEAERSPHLPELWLSVRDLDGLADRMIEEAEDEEWRWRSGFNQQLLNSQDYAVLDELLDRDGGPEAQLFNVTDAEAAAVLRFRLFMEKYDSGAFELDESAS